MPQPQEMFTGKYEWSGERQAGDCSLRVLDVAKVDDGDWECQVTASAFMAQDALTSSIAPLVVRGNDWAFQVNTLAINILIYESLC